MSRWLKQVIILWVFLLGWAIGGMLGGVPTTPEVVWFVAGLSVYLALIAALDIETC